MPKRPYRYPFGIPRRIEARSPLLESDIAPHLPPPGGAATIEIVVVPATAGYLFHIERRESRFLLYSYRSEALIFCSNITELTNFVNHASGLQFNLGAWQASEEIDRKIYLELDGENDDSESE